MVCRAYSLDEAIGTHNVRFHDRVKYRNDFVFLSYWENFLGTKKRDGISHGKQAIGVWVTEVLLQQ